jgi:hypothetical protein
MAALAALFGELNRGEGGRLVLDWDYVEVLAYKSA